MNDEEEVFQFILNILEGYLFEHFYIPKLAESWAAFISDVAFLLLNCGFPVFDLFGITGNLSQALSRPGD